MKKLESLTEKRKYYEKLYRRQAIALKNKNTTAMFQANRFATILNKHINRQINAMIEAGEADMSLLKAWWNFHSFCFDKYIKNYKRIRKAA